MELNHIQPHASEATAILKCMSKIWGIPPLQIRGPKTTIFRGFCNLTATLTAYISLQNVTRCNHKRVSALQSTRGLLLLPRACGVCSTPSVNCGPPHTSETVRHRELKFYTHLDSEISTQNAPFGNENISARGRFRGAAAPSLLIFLTIDLIAENQPSRCPAIPYHQLGSRVNS